MVRLTAKMARELGEALIDAAEDAYREEGDIQLEQFGEVVVALPYGMEADDPLIIVEARI